MIDLSFFKLNVFHSFVYKLTDFGAARELEAHEGFMSVYGTEEYLVGQILLAFFFNKYNTFKHTVMEYTMELFVSWSHEWPFCYE